MMLVGFCLPVCLGEILSVVIKNTRIYKNLLVRLSKELHIKVVHPKMMLVGFSLPVLLEAVALKKAPPNDASRFLPTRTI